MKHLLILFSACLLLASCSPIVTRGVQYAKLYEEKPKTIVIMPPINQTNFVEAKDYFYTTMYMPLVEKGYYVFSPYLTMDILQQESAYDSEMFLESDLSTFNKFLGADAAMFTIIKSWKRSNIGGALTAGVEYILRSAITGEILYRREGLITVDTSVNAGGSGLSGALINLAATALKTAATDKVVAGRQCNIYVLSDMPEGVYGKNHGKDASLPAGKPYLKGVVKK